VTAEAEMPPEKLATMDDGGNLWAIEEQWGHLFTPAQRRKAAEYGKRRERTQGVVSVLQGTKPPKVDPAGRRLNLTRASAITIRRARWLWDNRLPLGALTLLAGREGIGKSLALYTLAADVTRGRLDGEHHGTPRPVIIAASEDSWAHTIGPRLLAAGADLDLVHRVTVRTELGHDTEADFPLDVDRLADKITETGAVLLVLDPLLSRLDGRLDSHKDADVRLALEPLVALAERVQVCMVGVIHVNKSASTDPLNAVMASRAFTAVARAVLFVMADPDNDGVRLLGVVKSNLGPQDLPTLTFTVESAKVGKDPDDGRPITAPRLVWGQDTARSVRDVLEAAAEGPVRRKARTDAAEWLRAYLVGRGRTAPSADVYEAGKEAGHSEATLRRARDEAGVRVEKDGRTTYWRLNPDQVDAPVQGSLIPINGSGE
jgi:hypothetical protein